VVREIPTLPGEYHRPRMARSRNLALTWLLAVAAPSNARRLAISPGKSRKRTNEFLQQVCLLSRMGGGLASQYGVKPGNVAGSTKLCGNFRVTQQARRGGESFEMVGTCRFRGDQKTNEIDWNAVDGLKIDRARKPRKD